MEQEVKKPMLENSVIKPKLTMAFNETEYRLISSEDEKLKVEVNEQVNIYLKDLDVLIDTKKVNTNNLHLIFFNSSNIWILQCSTSIFSFRML